MKKTRLTESQIVAAPKESEAGVTIVELLRRLVNPVGKHTLQRCAMGLLELISQTRTAAKCRQDRVEQWSMQNCPPIRPSTHLADGCGS